MASLFPVVLLFLPLVTFYVQVAVAGDIRRCCVSVNETALGPSHALKKKSIKETPLGCPCDVDTECKPLHAICSLTCVIKDSRSCPTRSHPIGNLIIPSPCGNSKAMNTCICKEGYYENNKHGCSQLIHPKQPCANTTDTTGPCVIGAICNASGVCICSKNFKPTLINCTQVPTSHSSSHRERTTVRKPTSNLTGNLKGLQSSKSDSSSSTVKTTAPTIVRTTTPGNSASTTAAVEISAFILCFILAYFNVPN